MATDVLITFLPNEVIGYILEDAAIEISDVVRFALTCKHFYRTVRNDNQLWRTKFFQRWSNLKDVYEENEGSESKVLNWMEEVRESMNCRKMLHESLSPMSAQHYQKRELSNFDFKPFDSLFLPQLGAHKFAYYFLVDELYSLLKYGDNLTHKYYAFKVLRYLKQSYVRNEWYKFIALDPKQKILERGATLVAQWSQPEENISYTEISKTLDDIAERIKAWLKERYPTHSIFSVSKELLDTWKCNNIDDNQWNITETKQVMIGLREVLFEELGFHGNHEMYYSSENSFINKVLETRKGIPITLAIVFESVARRLGIRCESVTFPSHFLLRWKERYNEPDNPEIDSFYIDVFNRGRFLTKSSCPRVRGMSKCPIEKYNIYDTATAVEVVTRMAHNLELAARQRSQLNGKAARLRSALELRHLIQPNDTTVIFQLARFYMLHQMDLAELVEILDEIQKSPEDSSRARANHILQMLQIYRKQMETELQEEVEPKRRTPEVKYAVGLIMRHKGNNCLCVITGWHVRWMKTSGDFLDDNIQMTHLQHGLDQPIYTILTEDDSCRYAAQETLEMGNPLAWKTHHEIGRYFCKYNYTHYVPNEEKAREYPEDARVCNELVTLTYGS